MEGLLIIFHRLNEIPIGFDQTMHQKVFISEHQINIFQSIINIYYLTMNISQYIIISIHHLVINTYIMNRIRNGRILCILNHKIMKLVFK